MTTWTEQQLAEHLSKPKKPRPLTRKSPPVKISEKQRQNQVIVTLRSLSYVVLEVGQKRQPIFCSCGKKHWPITTGNTSGVADILVSHDRWPGRGAWLALEMKTPTTRRRPKQVELARRGLNVIVETVQEALEAVLHLERQWEIAPLPAMKAYWEQNK